MTTSEIKLVLEAFEAGKEIKRTCAKTGRTSVFNKKILPEPDWSRDKFEIVADKPRYREIPIEKHGGELLADGVRIDGWFGQSNFVGFKFAYGHVRSAPVWQENFWANIDELNSGDRKIMRATHVVVEEQ